MAIVQGLWIIMYATGCIRIRSPAIAMMLAALAARAVTITVTVPSPFMLCSRSAL